ncbi:MAG: LysM peptidoglycan-binding domain-containing protein [Clostridiales bacterium]|nr:LysM peptidoglycan-binding domain-containing protein [Clostridiales bacterium]
MNNKKKKYRINKLRFLASLMIITALIVISALSVYGAVNGADALNNKDLCTEYTLVEVAEGDSVWSLASTFCNDNTDVRKAVDAICYVNGIEDYVIYPGQELLIPSC